MNTPTHLLVSVAALGKPGKSKLNLTVIGGALLPDMSIYVLFLWAKLIAQVPERQIWQVLYWQEPWQTLSAISNSIPFYAALLILGLFLRWPLFWVFAASALLHIGLDFPFHTSDAHRHFWPFSDWRFHSPLSYWDRSHHGDWVSAVEFLLGVGLIIFIWRRFTGIWVRSALAIGLISYVAVPAYFALTLGH